MLFRIPKTSPPEQIYYNVYYNQETGSIASITTKDRPHLKTHYTTTFNEVEEFITGAKNLIDYKVVYDLQTANYFIAHKNDKIVLDIDNLVHQITSSDNAQLTVIKNNVSNKWQIVIDLELTYKNNIDKAAILDETLWFSITQKNNPNVLYRHFCINLQELLDNKVIDIDFLSQDESKLTNYSVYTNRRLVSYSTREINE